MNTCAECSNEDGDPVVECHDGVHRCRLCCIVEDCCTQCGAAGAYANDDTEDWMVGLCQACQIEAWSLARDDAAISSYYHGGRG